MPVPEFIQRLRARIGTDFLLLPGVRAVVYDDAERVLMIRRSDFDRWDLPSGIIEPGEQPAQTVVREVFEETGLVVRPDEILCVYAGESVTYPNGDTAQYVTIVFGCSVVGGDLMADGAEALEVAFVPVDESPAAERLVILPGAGEVQGAYHWDEAWLTGL